MALYANLTWLLWALGVPVAIGTVQNNEMGSNYWVGPVILIFAVISYYFYQWQIKTMKNEKLY